MEPKKTDKADVDKRGSLYFQIGLVLSLLFVIVAFSWVDRDEVEMTLASNIEFEEEEEMADITKEEEKPPPPPPPPPVIEVVEEIEEEEEEEIEFEEEIEEEDEIEIPDAPDEPPAEEPIFEIVEEQAEFPGGYAKMMKFLQDNIQYPAMEKDNDIQGTVYVQFVVEKDGSITQTKAVKGPTGNMKQEAVRVVKMMPKWNPGKQRGKAVRVKFTLPVKYRLR